MHESQYFEFIRYAMASDAESVPDFIELDWHGLYRFACEQAIAGVVFEGVKKLSEQQSRPPFNLLMEWIGLTEQIAKQNRILNRRCVEVVREYQEVGFQCCVLKGQGNAAMYPNPLSRTAGDIDILIKDVNRSRLIEYVKTNKKVTGCHFHHIEYYEDGVSIELHFVPCSANNPFYHRRLQKWFIQTAKKENIWENKVYLSDMEGSIAVPTVSYNLIYQLAHLRHHFFDEGIGLRQFVDYYFVLKAQNDGRWLMADVSDTLRYLGLWKFAGAVMYVMQEVFHLDKAFMIAPVDERRGKTLMAEILKGGNFGQHSGLTNHSVGGKYLAKTLRNLHFIREYPAEALCEPVFRTWHFFWRQWQRW